MREQCFYVIVLDGVLVFRGWFENEPDGVDQWGPFDWMNSRRYFDGDKEDEAALSRDCEILHRRGYNGEIFLFLFDIRHVS